MALSPPSLVRAWASSAAWALGCIGGCLLVRWWADENGAFEFGSRGLEQIGLLAGSLLVGGWALQAKAYAKFHQAYLITHKTTRPLSQVLAVCWLLALSLLRVVWLLAGLLLVLATLLKTDIQDAGWR